MSGFTPVNQVRLTNVATVKLQKRGKRFEIACYRNKVLSWRNKLETDIREVLQIDTVFINVSKGMLANTKDLMDAFGTTDQKLVCQEILDKGELQVSEQERGALYETIFRDIASIVADKTVNPENNRPYTITMIQNAMRQIQYSVNVSKSSKSQALDVIRKLRDIMPIARASMLIRVICPISDLSNMNNEIEKNGGLSIPSTAPVHDGGESQESDGTTYIDVKIDPENFRKLEESVKSFTGARVEVLQLRMAGAVGVGGGAVESKDDNFEDEVEEKPPVVASKSSKKQPQSTTKREEKAKTKDDLSKILSEVTGRADIAEDSEEDGAEFDEFAKTSNNKKKNKKAKKSAEKVENNELPVIPETSSEVSFKSESSAVPNNVNGKMKMSKKDKRLEKDEKREKEQQAKQLQERINNEKKKKEETTKVEIEEPTTAEGLTSESVVVPCGPPLEVSAPSANSSEKVQSCNTCGGSFCDVKSYRDHFKSEWHRFNLKRKLKNLPAIKSEEEFLSLSIEDLQI